MATKKSNISISIDLKNSVVDAVGLSPVKVTRINRIVSNEFLKDLDKFIPPRIASDNNIVKTGFKKHRIKRKRATSRGARRLKGTFWVGENDVLAQFKKGAWKKTKNGAGKGSFFQKKAFILTLKSGKKMLFTRTSKGIEPVRVPLHGYEKRVKQGLAYAQKNVLSNFKKQTKIALGK